MTSILLWRQKTCVCRDKSMLVETKPLSRQNYVCCDKYLSRNKFCREKHVLVAANIILSRQAYFSRDKKSVLSRQTLVCRTNPVFVATKLWARQKRYLWQLPPILLLLLLSPYRCCCGSSDVFCPCWSLPLLPVPHWFNRVTVRGHGAAQGK